MPSGASGGAQDSRLSYPVRLRLYRFQVVNARGGGGRTGLFPQQASSPAPSVRPHSTRSHRGLRRNTINLRWSVHPRPQRSRSLVPDSIQPQGFNEAIRSKPVVSDPLESTVHLSASKGGKQARWRPRGRLPRLGLVSGCAPQSLGGLGSCVVEVEGSSFRPCYRWESRAQEGPAHTAREGGIQLWANWTVGVGCKPRNKGGGKRDGH